LVLDGIETGQKSGDCIRRQFRTFDPVDIQQLIHKAGLDQPVLVPTRAVFRGLAAGLVDVVPASYRVRVRSRTFFLRKQGGRTVDVASVVVGAT
jgi:hypothetical protein